MLEHVSHQGEPQKRKGLGDHITVRAALLLRGRTLRSFATKHDVSTELVRQVISGRCPGKRGVAAKVRADIEAAMKKPALG
jgi:hypothetical protein